MSAAAHALWGVAATISIGNGLTACAALRACSGPDARRMRPYTSPKFTADINTLARPRTASLTSSLTFAAPGLLRKNANRAPASNTYVFIYRARPLRGVLFPRWLAKPVRPPKDP